MSANGLMSAAADTPSSGTKITEHNHVPGILSTDKTQSNEPEAYAQASGSRYENDESTSEYDDVSSCETDDLSFTEYGDSIPTHDESMSSTQEKNDGSPHPETTGGFDYTKYNPWGIIVSHSKKPGYDPLGAVFTPEEITIDDSGDDAEPLPCIYQPHYRFRHVILEACDEAQLALEGISIRDGERALYQFFMSERILRKKVHIKHTTPLSQEWHLARCEEQLRVAQSHFGKARDSFGLANLAMRLVYESALAAMDAPTLDEIEAQSREGPSESDDRTEQSGEDGVNAEDGDDLTAVDCGISKTEESRGNPATALLNTVGQVRGQKRERDDGEDTTGLDDEPSRKKAKQ